MTGSRFDAWTRRRFGIAAVGVMAGWLGASGQIDARAKRKKKKKRKRRRAQRCEPLRTRCNPKNERELCCPGLACSVTAEQDGYHCCRLRYSECESNADCCRNLRCVSSDPPYCDV